MRNLLRYTNVLLLAASAALLVSLSALAKAESVPATLPPPTSPPDPGWLILPEFPEDATQADVGAEVYRLVCQDCHGDQRQGLTAEWIATWPEGRQNCWTSKCHAGNHPPDGFELPHNIPAVGGEGALSRFDTALDLYQFIRANMPWHNPGSLTDEQYWQLAAFLIREQNIASLRLPLNEARARNLRLYAEAVAQELPERQPASQAKATILERTTPGCRPPT